MVAERSRPFVRGSITSDIEEAAAISAPQLRDAPAPAFPLLPPALDRLSTHFPTTTRTSILPSISTHSPRSSRTW